MVEQTERQGVLFGTFQGVFRPIVLTTLGAMLYLREGWLVGNNGLLGAIAILILCYAITGTTALSVSSIATNQRVRPGGAFAIIGQALGLEAGGAIGLPLFIAQTLSSAMYLYAFSEAWGHLFPHHPAGVVVVCAFLGVASLVWTSASLVSRASNVLMVVIAVALFSAFFGLFGQALHRPVLVGGFPDATFLESFAIFFPAATGIMVGVGMSGQLLSPRRSLPRGTMGAWAFTFLVYLFGAFWYAWVATPEELVAHMTIAVDRAAIGVFVLLGLVTATLSAALSSLIAAPRLLHAMAEVDVVPGARFLRARSGNGEPRRATVVTLAIAALGLSSGSLDAIAPIITAFFLLTYLALNFVVLLEQRLGMISFRPTFAISSTVPALGVVLSGLALFLASPRSLLVLGLFTVVGFYVVLSRRQLDTPWETVRSGVSVTLAAWAARRVADEPRSERAWKPDVLVPVRFLDDAERLEGLLRGLTLRNGSIKLLGIGEDGLRADLDARARRLRADGIQARCTVVEGTDLGQAVRLAMDAMQGDLFPPNVVLLDLSRTSAEHLRSIQSRCRELRLGLLLFHPGPEEADPEARKGVEVWLSDQHPHWRLDLHVANVDLPVLGGYLLGTAWAAPMNLVTVVRDPASVDAARDFLRSLTEAARLPRDTTVEVLTGSFRDCLADRRSPHLCLFGIGPQVERAHLLDIARASGTACLFLMDSGNESALA